jgi:hypothetical protein
VPPASPPPPPRVRARAWQALAASRRKFGRDSAAGGRQARWAQCRSREVLQGLSQQRVEPPAQAQELAQLAAQAAAQAQELVQPAAPAAQLVRARSSLVAVQRAATQLLGKGAARHNRTTSGMRRLRLLK